MRGFVGLLITSCFRDTCGGEPFYSGGEYPFLDNFALFKASGLVYGTSGE